MTDLQSWEEDKALYLFTSLTAGSSHVITATSRIETILKNARIPFSYIDTATNESARKLFQRRGKGKKLPLLVKAGFVIADLEQVEDWNEFGELKEAIGPVATSSTSVTTTPAKAPATGASSAAGTPSKPPAHSTSKAADSPSTTAGAPDASISHALRKAAFESASAAKERKSSTPSALKDSSTPAKPAAAPPDNTPLSPSAVPLPMSPLPPTSPTARSRHGSSASSIAQKQYVPEHFDPPPATHRGSSLSLASEEEIREIESKETIVEEDEGEEEQDAVRATDAVEQPGRSAAAHTGTKEGKTTDASREDEEALVQKLDKVQVGK